MASRPSLLAWSMLPISGRLLRSADQVELSEEVVYEYAGV